MLTASDRKDLSPQGPPELGPEQLDALARRLAKEGVHFPVKIYKEGGLARRVSMRIRATGCADINSYLQLLDAQPDEGRKLLKALTINVSHFFRNPSVFEMLKKVVLPMLFSEAARVGKKPLIWSLGCAAGEEPYSMAILLRDGFMEQLEKTGVSLLASDIDQQVLELASVGIYEQGALKELSPDQIVRWFKPEGERFRIEDELKALVEFRCMDISNRSDYPVADLVLCRNILIYFNRQAQEKILHAIADNLSANGILVLGKSETLVGSVRGRFNVLCPVERVYRLKQ